MTEIDSSLEDTQDLSSDIYTLEEAVRPEFVARLRGLIAQNNTSELAGLIEPLHESELGDVLEALDVEDRTGLVNLMGSRFDFTALTEVDEAIRLEIVNRLPNALVAEAVKELDSDDAVFILEDMATSDQEDILAKLPFEERMLLKRSLDYPEETAGRRMQTEFIAVPPFWTVGQTIDFMREDENLPDRFHEIYVIDPSFKLVGYVALDRLLRTKRGVPIADIKEKNIHPIDARIDQEEAARVFEQYDLLSAAVVDDGGRLVGMLTIDDVVDVIQQEADEDIKRLAGVGDEELSDTVWTTARSRFTWLFLNLVTSILASIVIGLFDATLEQMVALAILMPIVASMGGNAGTQTMTVAVRALATRDMDTYNMLRTIKRELLVGIFNGLIFALLIGIVAAIWFANPQLGLVIAIAMVINMVFAALSGILIPIMLARAKIDPAIASSVFVTTVTDVVGFLAFLGLAAWWFGLG